MPSSERNISEHDVMQHTKTTWLGYGIEIDGLIWVR